MSSSFVQYRCLVHICGCFSYEGQHEPLSAGPPTIELREALEGEEGCDISMVARISGCPFPRLTWHKASPAKPEEKTAIQYDQHINKLVTQDKCTLLVQQATRHDSALYSLTASNSLGTVSKDIKLSVFGKKLEHVTSL